MSSLQELLAQNKSWADNKASENPDFFPELAKQQSPKYLWIGCSDSRVPANQILGLAPGEVFVHRNIANQVIHSDLNCLSVLQYAVEVLKVKHVMVVGHYGCGGVKAALENQQHGLIDNWLGHIKDVYRLHKQELDAQQGESRFSRLCELNVIEQVANVCNSTIVQDAWNNGQDLTVHGLVYGLQTGMLEDLNVSVSRKQWLDAKK